MQDRKEMDTVDAFFKPKGIAVVGVSTDQSKPSSAIFARLIENKKAGNLKASIYPVNPKYREICGHRVYPSVSEIEGEVDLVITAIPAELTPSVIEDCGRKGVKAVIVVSGGFAEAGRKDLEDKLVSVARKYGIRIMGPNTIGLLDTYSGVDTLFLPRKKKLSTGEELDSLPMPKRGNLTIITQSGALGEIIMDTLFESGVGLRALVGVGNQADLTVEDLLEYFVEDEKTKAIALYLEGVKDGRKFVRSAHKASLKKPIIVLKAGKTGSGAKAAFTHTASMVGNIDVYRGAFKQIGLIEARDLEELIDFSKIYSMQKPVRGKRVLIISNAGGAAVLASDVAPLYGLELPPLSDEDKARLDELKKERIILPMVVYTNPLDLTGSASTEGMVKAYEALAQSPNFDMHLLIPTHQPPTLDERVIDGFGKVAKKCGKSVAGCEMGESAWSKLFRSRMDEYSIPSYPTPERAIRALYSLTLYRKKKIADLTISKSNRLTWLNSIGKGEINYELGAKILREYGIPTPPTYECETTEEAKSKATSLGYPVVLKAIVKGVTHKSDIGGVVLSLKDEEEVALAFNRLKERVEKRKLAFEGVIVQKMVKGVEVIVGSIWDEQFGPVISVGVGGIFTELLKDFSVRVAPILKEEAEEMLEEIKLSKLLDGYRGIKPVNKSKLAEVIESFSRILPENPSIKQLEVNPLICLESDIYAVDIRGLIS